MVWTQKSCHKSVKYDRPDECRQTERKSGQWRWLPVRFSKRQSISSQTVLLRTTLTRTFILYRLSTDIVVSQPLHTSNFWFNVAHRGTSCRDVSSVVSPSQDYTHPDVHTLPTYHIVVSQPLHTSDFWFNAAHRGTSCRDKSPVVSPSQDYAYPDDHTLLTYMSLFVSITERCQFYFGRPQGSLFLRKFTKRLVWFTLLDLNATDGICRKADITCHCEIVFF